MTTLKSELKKYRQGIRKLEKLKAQSHNIIKLFQKTQDDISHITSDLIAQKIIIDFCIQTGQSPVIARLSNTVEDMTTYLQKNNIYSRSDETINQSSLYNYTSYTSAINSTTLGTTSSANNYISGATYGVNGNILSVNVGNVRP